MAGLAILANLPAQVGGPGRYLRRGWPRLLPLAAALIAIAAWPTIGPRVSTAIGDLHASLTGRAWYREMQSLPWSEFIGYACTAAAVVIVVFQHRLIRTLRRWQVEEESTKADRKVWKLHPVAHSAGVAAHWCWVYGLCYVTAILVLLRLAGIPGLAWKGWEWVALGTAATFAFVLLLIAPWWLPLRARKRIQKALADEATPSLYRPDELAAPTACATIDRATVEKCLVKRLEVRGQAYRFLALRKRTHDASPNEKDDELRLTRAGRRLAYRIGAALLAASPR